MLNIFWYCSGIKSVTIGDGLTSIPEKAFYDCTNLESITWGNNISSIGESAFWNTGLTSIVIPNCVKKIGKNAFYDCAKLTTVDTGNGVTDIEDNAFYRCRELNTITFGNHVTSISNGVLDVCKNIKTIISLNTTPPYIKSKTFQSYHYSVPLQVPIGSKEAYQNDMYWKNFTNINETDQTGIQSISLDIDKGSSFYDLNGRKVERPQKGINIIEGKKVLVK